VPTSAPGRQRRRRCTPGLRLGSRRRRLINRPTFPIEHIHRGRPEKLLFSESFASFHFRYIFFSPPLFGSARDADVSLDFQACAGTTLVLYYSIIELTFLFSK